MPKMREDDVRQVKQDLVLSLLLFPVYVVAYLVTGVSWWQAAIWFFVGGFYVNLKAEYLA